MLDQRGINYLQLINPDKLIDGFDLSKNKIINLDDLKIITKLKKNLMKKITMNKYLKWQIKFLDIRTYDIKFK